MRIRWKLFIALFLLTAGTIAVVLFAAEREFRNWVRAEVTQRFEAQLDGLLKARTERLAELRTFCTQLATQPIVKNELKGHPSPALREQFIEELMKSRPAGQGIGGRNRPAGGNDGTGPGTTTEPRDNLTPGPPAGRLTGGGGRGAPSVGVIDLQGNPIPFGGPLQRGRANSKQTAERVQSLSKLPSQAVAYVIFRDDNTAGSSVQEVVLTPVIDDDGTPLGWFYLGRDAETRVERSFQQSGLNDGRNGRSGLVADGQWFVNGVPDDEAAAIEATVSDTFWTRGEPEILRIDGNTLLVVARDLNPDSPLGKGYQVAIFPLDSFIVALGHLRYTVAWIGAAAMLATSLLAFLLAGRFSRPIAELVAGTERIRRGDLGGDVMVRSKDEFGTLATAFNAMTRDLALKERYREVLSMVSDPGVAQQLVEGGLELGGEVRHAAVLFCDIRGFTAMTEGMPPAEVIEFINEHMTALTKLVYLHGGVVDKFVGDLIMAIFGAPNSHGDDALRAARCALEMIAVRQQLSHATGRIVEIGIGLAYGELVAGCMGSTDRLNYTVLGDRVNLASRLCSAAAPGEVIVDDAIAAALDGTIRAEPREPVLLKGFSAPVPSFAIHPQP